MAKLMGKILFTLAAFLLILPAAAQEAPEGDVVKLQGEVQELRQQLEIQKTDYDQRLENLLERLDRISRGEEPPVADDSLDSLLEAMRQESAGTPAARSGIGGFLQSFNPDMSVIIDFLYHWDNSKHGIVEVLEEMDGFPHNCNDDHHHHGLTNGFQLRELELYLSGEVDPYFKAWTTLGFTLEGVEIEEAVIQTTSLPWGFQAKGGKFFSDFGRINAQHAHDWDFVDRPLISELLFGDHGLNEVGVQVTWLAPTRSFILLGAEALQGKNENLFNYEGHDGSNDNLDDRSGPRAFVQWLKFAPVTTGNHAMQFGVSHGFGKHQEGHGIALANEHWLEGDSRFYGADAVYKYDAGRPYGQGNITVQGEYLIRRKDLTLESHLTSPHLVGNARREKQDGFYVQGVYGFAPRWRAGVRYDHVGLENRVRRPNGVSTRYGDSWRTTAMIDFTPTEFSRIRLQGGRGEYMSDGDREEVYQVFLQVIISLGAHGAHKF